MDPISLQQSEIIHKEKFRRLEALIYVFGINPALWTAYENDLKGNHTDVGASISIKSMVADLGIVDHKWLIIEQRVGFEKKLSFEEIALNYGGVTRARIQQIIEKSAERIDLRLKNYSALLYMLEYQRRNLWLPLIQTNSITTTLCNYQASLIETGWQHPEETDIRRLLLSLRLLVDRRYEWVQNQFPELSYAVCSISPGIPRHNRVGREHADLARKQFDSERKWKYEELIEAVLTEAKTPLHYMEIARRAERLERRDDFNLKAIHNTLLRLPEKFAYVDQGTYGLTTWGLVSVNAYTKIIAEVLTTAHKALPYGNILHAVIAKRAVKHQTIKMHLDMHPRFYCSLEGTYGLRAWLLPREKQTLRTPKWQVETPQSFERVERAKERGYDIVMVVAQDKH